MNGDLTLWLAVVAAAVIMVLAVQGVVASRRAQPKRAADAARVEPSLGGPPPGVGAPLAEAAPVGDEAVVPDSVGDAAAALPAAPAPRRPARLDPLIDALAPLTVEQPVTGELALMHLPASRRAGTKPYAIEGLNVDTQAWEPPAPGQRYAEFQAGVQLANRHGALNEIEFSEFVQKVQGFAEAIGAFVQFPDMLDEVARARELDAFANTHDAQLAVHLKARSAAWSVGYIQQCALQRGFVPGSVPGRLVLPGAEEGAPPVLVLSFDAQAALAEDPNEAALRTLTLSLDVPQTAEAAEPFTAWQDAARHLAADMDALLVDDQGQPITLGAFAAIGRELQGLYARLAERDLAAGSVTARRVFS
ncbi:cell division protein ZipA C-terminal FtsZ-binding domain-containing protein [Aquabacterium sp. J223]|uniref:cell division protein ZipA C-terminal FtsZ-binding domain-containing protein n=1 Tax=Aquabacterium sp. J223 TaxID=2898431 RepID=UPI0021ADAA4F|nr:cell division protein ZipA C-terminal FtsZ-binding domain-containing protein [Aquabacterium sp. J223]UUX97210.1 cell division protein FtsZ [Aquabacterium sp. J223]